MQNNFSGNNIDEHVDDLQDFTVIFLHIPKCAGTTFVEEIIRRRFPPENLLIHYKEDTRALMKRLSAMKDHEKRRLKCIAGHFAFGIHKYLPQPCKYVTILRNPVERVISLFDYARREKNHYLHELASARGTSLLDYIRSPQNIEVKNGQVLLLAGIGWGVHSGKTGEEILERARKNLQDDFALVGVTEQFDDFLHLLRRIIKWDIGAYEKKNVNLQPTYLKDLPVVTLNAIAACNRLDQKLYDDVKKAFNNRLKLCNG